MGFRLNIEQYLVHVGFVLVSVYLLTKVVLSVMKVWNNRTANFTFGV